MKNTLLLSLLLSVVAPLAQAHAAEPPALGASEDQAAAPAPGEEAAPSQATTPAEPKVKVTPFMMPHPGVSEEDVVEVMRSIESGLRKNERLDVKDLDTRLAGFAQEVPVDAVDAARQKLADGQQALHDLRIPEAVQKLQEAIDQLVAVLQYVKKQELADAMAALAVAQYEGGDKQSGNDEFVELLTWRPDYVYDPTRFPPRYGSRFDDAARRVLVAKRQPITVHTDPEGAQAYVDGKYVGVTPCTTGPLPVGRHFVTLKKEGHKKAAAAVVARADAPAQVEVALTRMDKYLLVEQARDALAPKLGDEELGADADTLKTVLFLDQAVFVKAAPTSDGQLGLDAWLYDLRTRRRLSHVHQVLPKAASAQTVDEKLAALPQQLYLGVSYEGVLVAPKDAPLKGNEVPVYKKWWLWTAVAAGVVVAGGAVGAGLAIDATRDPGCPGGAHCISFQP